MIKRTYGWHRDTNEARCALGRLYRATRFKNIQFPASFDLGTPPNPAFSPLDQGQLGACTGFGCKRVAWYGLNALALQQTPPAAAPEPSALFQYYNERKDDGDVDIDAGSTISEGINALKTYGICPEQDWPYDPARFAVCPPLTVYNDAMQFRALEVENIPVDANFCTALQDCLFNQRLPVVFGADLFSQFESDQCAADGLVALPPIGATPIGGHCQCIRGWKPAADGSLLFQIQNSWGSWGDNGCDWMPIVYLQFYASDFWAVVKME